MAKTHVSRQFISITGIFVILCFILIASGISGTRTVQAASLLPAPTDPAPPAATPVTPASGATVIIEPVTFTWSEITTATWYKLVLTSGSTTVFSQWYFSSGTLCSGGNCSVTPIITLGNGTAYSWTVQTWNPNGYGPVSGANSFTFYRLTGAPAQTSPYWRVSTYQPTYIWNSVATATGYQLQVQDPTGATVVDAALTTSVCSGSVCQTTPSVTLTSGPSKWRVNATNPAGTGPYSDWMPFTTPLGTATLTSPTGDWITDPVTYTWQAVTQATWYKLNVKNSTGADVINNWYLASAVCSGATCAVTPAVTLNNGEQHTWNILPWNESWGYGNWGTAMSFIPYRIPAAANLIAPLGCVDVYNPTYTWDKVPGATQYTITVTGTSAPAPATVNASSVCSGTSCSTTLTGLASDAYTWTVTSTNPAGSTPSAAAAFSTPMAQATLTAPTGDIITDPVVFTWSSVTQANNYNLEVKNGAGTVIYTTSYTTAACAGATCTASIPVATLGLTSGSSYTWRIQPTKTCAVGSGTGLWSNPMSFNFWAIPAAPTLTAPSGCINNYNPTYTWSKVNDATSYTVTVAGPSAPAPAIVYPTSCSGSSCSTTLSALVSGAYTFTVASTNPAGSTTSAATAFSTPLQPVTLVSPNAVNITTTPMTFTWNATAQAESYTLEVIGPTGSPVYSGNYTATAAGCASGTGTCSIAESATVMTLVSGSTYTWHIRPMKTCGASTENGGWSGTMSFTYYSIPAPATLTAPTGCTTGYTPTYTWNAVTGATQYTITVTGPSAPAPVTVNASAVCSGSTCSTTLAALVTGNYSWIVTSINPAGSTPSTPMTFTTPMTTATLTSPSGDWITDPVTFTWQEVTLADSYNLEVRNSTGTVVFTGGPYPSSVCIGGVCSVTPTVTLTNGEQHTWRIQPANATCGGGSWSAAMAFIPYRIPAAAVLVSPAAASCPATYQPTFTWNAVQGATSYTFTLTGPSTNISTVYSASSVCSGTTCSVTPSGTLGVGSFTWNIVSTNPAGSTPSTAVTFNTPIVAPTLIPFTNNQSLTNPVVYTWNVVPSATWYKLQVDGTEGNVVNTWFDASLICSGTTCTASPAVTLINGGQYTWKVIAWNPACTYSPWSSTNTFTAYRVPDVPVLVSPTGCASSNQPTYTWNVVQGALQYKLWVDGPSGNLINRWYTPGSGGLTCNTTTCSVTPSEAEPGGNYTWWVLSSNPAGATWSASATFTTPYLPPTPSTPSSTWIVTPVVYTWSAIPSATQYRLNVKDGTGADVINTLYTVGVEVTCSGGSCSVTPSTALTSGSAYTWRVQAVTACGAGSWSSTVSFTYYSTPAAPTLTSPSGCISTNQPTYTWNAVTGATQYKLYVSLGATPVLSSWYTPGSGGLTCTAGVCTVTPSTTLAAGDYSWYVLSYNPAGQTWSAATTFTAPPAPPTLVSPTGSITGTSIVYTWSVVSGATQYRLNVKDGTGADVINTLYTVGVEVTCSGSNCSVTPSTALTTGNYTWRVQGVAACGAGAWSSTMSFSYLTAPVAATLVSPTGTITTNRPTYVWNNAVGVAQYLLWVDGPSGNVIQTWYNASALCSGATCQVTPAVDLPQATYTWYIKSWNVAGAAWSTGMSFTTPLPSPTLTAPANSSTVTINPPTFSWSVVSGATGYQLLVTGPSGTVINSLFTVGVNVTCSAGTCSMASPTSLENGAFTWNVTANNSTSGIWSAPSPTWSFTMQAPPGAATLVSPTGSISTSSPTYTWNAVPGATSYIFNLTGNGTSFTHEYTASTICSGGVCTVTPGVTIGSGATYSWKVQTRNSIGYGPWSSIFTFTY